MFGTACHRAYLLIAVGLAAISWVAPGCHGEELIKKHYVPVRRVEMIDGKPFYSTELIEEAPKKSPIGTKLSPEGTGNRIVQVKRWDQADVARGKEAIRITDAGCRHRLTVGSDALFEFDKDTLTPEAEKTLTVLGPMLQQYGQHPVTIEGHTDAIGSDDYNQDLSERRARTVKQWLVEHGFAREDNAEIVGYGRKRPVAPNTYTDGTDYPQGRQKNRRVELVVDTCQ